ncbi:hypothetical protein B14911_22422 [Bacillus sp. NRRL B-14911]|nr:hypothetical protein B14911_22422 [Bacillus sp. NRRL B-14911]
MWYIPAFSFEFAQAAGIFSGFLYI